MHKKLLSPDSALDLGGQIFDASAIVLDGRMDEPAWDSVPEFTGFKRLKNKGGGDAPVQTSFKILPCKDRVYFGVKCFEPDMKTVIETHPFKSIWNTDVIELYISPSGRTFDFYQLVTSLGEKQVSIYYAEGGNIRPDPFAPVWNSKVYTAEDYWSLEVELPLTAFYMTPADAWSTEWLVNVTRSRTDAHRMYISSWCQLNKNYIEPGNYARISGFPQRPEEDSVRIISAAVELNEAVEGGCKGNMTVKTMNPTADTFEFSSDYTDTVELNLAEGANEFTVPCFFGECARYKVPLELTRKSDRKSFKRFYPITVTYEPLKVRLTLPEYRDNFYPGQDYSKVVGKAVTSTGKPVTVKLEGPGIETKVITPDADGSFIFETSGFEPGDAYLTASIDGFEVKKKIRRLLPTGHMMTWISGGNLIVNGEPVLRRNMYAEYYRGGEAFRRRYDADNLHITKQIKGQKGWLEPGRLIKGIENAEASKDVMPCDKLLRMIDETIEANRDRDFAYYYISDEPECRGISPVYIRNIYNYVADKDPYHVVLTASRSASSYIDCADWYETHPYINPQNLEDGQRIFDRPINTLGSFIDDIIRLDRPDKCIGFLPTCFSYKYSSLLSDYPTFPEMVCHTWAAMIHGGKTLDPYAYHDLNDRAALYEGIRYIFSSFEAVDKLVLLGKRTVLFRDSEINSVLYETDDEKMFVLVNMTNAPKSVTLDNLSGKWLEFRGERTFEGNSFELKPFEVIIGTSTKKDAGLPTYAETEALVDKLEYERTHRGSVLFDRWRDVTVTASSSTSKYKLFDGVIDNLGWDQVSGDDKFYEVEFTGFRPEFSKYVVYGWNLEGTELKVRNGGELSVPEIAEKIEEEFCTTFIFKEKIKPEAVRLEFKQDRIELYEIEAY